MRISFEAVKERIGRERARKLLRRPAVYALGQVMVRRNLLKFPYRATTMMVEYGLGQTGKAYNRSLPSVWTSAFFPTELLHALDITPFSPEVAAALVAALGFQGGLLQEAEARWWGRDNCSFHRSAMGGLFTGYYPLPDAFCAASHLCDGAVLLFENLAQHYERPFLLLDTPLKHGGESLRYVTVQLEEIAGRLQSLFNRTLKREKLREAVANAERARRAMLKVNELRLEPACPFTAQEAFNLLFLNFTGLGSGAMPRIYETLAEELTEKNRTGGKSQKPPRYRLLWLHLPPFYKNNLLAYLQEKGAKVVFEEFSHVYWGEMDPGRPLQAIAGRMLSHFGYGHIDRRIRVIKELARRFGVDGVIHFSHWGCRQSCGGLRIIRDALQKEGLPLLVLDGDCIDNRNYAPGQVRTRIDSFLEMLD